MPSETHLPEYLQTLWKETIHSKNIAFLKRALSTDISLQDLLAVLRFDALTIDRRSVTLREVLRAQPLALPTPARNLDVGTAAAQPQPLRQPPAAPPPRTRRRRHQTSRMKDVLLAAIRAADEGIRTHELSDKLEKEGFEGVGTATTNIILKALEGAGMVVSNNSRPKVWRAKVQGRRMPEPIVIRRPAELRVVSPADGGVAAKISAQDAVAGATSMAAAAQAAVAAAASAEAPHTELLSQAEVAAAAALLRKRFFK